jgi:hypothetical protein
MEATKQNKMIPTVRLKLGTFLPDPAKPWKPASSLLSFLHGVGLEPAGGKQCRQLGFSASLAPGKLLGPACTQTAGV